MDIEYNACIEAKNKHLWQFNDLRKKVLCFFMHSVASRFTGFGVLVTFQSDLSCFQNRFENVLFYYKFHFLDIRLTYGASLLILHV